MTNSSANAALLEQLLSSTNSQFTEEQAVIGLFSELRHPLLRYVLTFGLSAHDAEEIVQEGFLQLFKHLQRGKSRANLPGWIFRVCHNLALKHLDRARRSNAACDGAATAIDQSLNPEELLVEAQRRQKLQAVLRALPEQDRYCVCLRAEGLRYRDIADILGISLGAVSLSLVRSFARFARADQEC
jgi:RNA polymerase sigma-70 factor (ECF subfamily)